MAYCAGFSDIKAKVIVGNIFDVLHRHDVPGFLNSASVLLQTFSTQDSYYTSADRADTMRGESVRGRSTAQTVCKPMHAELLHTMRGSTPSHRF